jgi:hypothetical protein
MYILKYVNHDQAVSAPIGNCFPKLFLKLRTLAWDNLEQEVDPQQFKVLM